MINATFITAGRATFTVEPTVKFCEVQNAKPHYTFKVSRKDSTYSRSGYVYFVSLLSGPDNTSDYTYLGLLEENGDVRLTAKSAFGEDTNPVKIVRRVVKALFEGRGEQIVAAGWKVHHEGACGRCGRALTVPQSIESGIGPECAKKMTCVAA